MYDNLKQLKTNIDKLIEAQENVDVYCGDYTHTSEDTQQDYKDLLEFRKMQFESRVKHILETYFK